MARFQTALLNLGCAVAALLAAAAAWFETSAELRVENLALRQKIGVLRRSAPKRRWLTRADRAFWVWLGSVWARWDQVLRIVKPATVQAWRRKGFRLFWMWRVRRGNPGPPSRRKS